MTTKPVTLGNGKTKIVTVVMRKKRDDGRVLLTIRIKEADRRRLQELAISEGTSMDALARAGISRVFVDRGLPPIEA